MANWALVIGIDRYLKQEICLHGAVRDALSVVEWLLRVDGGAVPPRNLFLVLGRTANSPPIPQGMQPRDITKKGDILDAIDELLQRSNGEGENFYFYFSGHGINASKDWYEENAIVSTDFSERHTDNALSLRSIYELFKGTHFRQQFFIIDACRNLPWQKDYRIGECPVPLPPTRPAPSQFIMYATSSGTKASEIDEQGVFTAALLAALHGDGIAKEWDENAQEYVLRWNNVFKQVKQIVEGRMIPAGEGLIQAPRQAGENRGENPELGRLAPDSVPEVTLDVYLEPENTAPQAKVVVGHRGGEIRHKSHIDQLPIQFLLKPRPYSVRAAAPGYHPQRDYYPVDLYLPSQVSIKLLQGEAISVGEEPEAYLTKGLGDSQTPGVIEIHTSDALAIFELLDSAGRVVDKGEGQCWQSRLAPGFYRACLITPERERVEELIELQPGVTQKIHLKAASTSDTPLFRDVLATTGMTKSDDNSIEPSEAVGSMTTAQLSTILALAGGAANEETAFGDRLRKLGVSAFRDFVSQPATSGIQVLFGIEAENPATSSAFLAQTKVRCWKQQAVMPAIPLSPQQLSGPTGLAEYAWAAEPGQHWLSIETPGQRPIAFAITALPNRLSLLVFHHQINRDIAIYQYLPALVPGADNEFDHRDGKVARFPVLQRSELIQRAYLAGRLEEPKQNAMELLYAKWVEPIAGILGGYIQLRVDPRSALLDIATNNMVNFFGEISDSHVLRAEFLEIQGSTDAAVLAYRAALDRGMPVMQEGVAYLLAGVARHRIEHPQVSWLRQMYERRVPGLLWTAVPVESL